MALSKGINNLINIIRFNKYKNEMSGKRIDWDKQYWFQCVDLIRDYTHTYDYPRITTYWNAIDLWKKWLWDWYKRINNSILSTPSVWDIILFNTWTYGHIAIAWRWNPIWIEILEQNAGNWNGNWLWDNSIRVTKNFYKNCVGWFSPIS